jgi:hypothetical protein
VKYEEHHEKDDNEETDRCSDTYAKTEYHIQTDIQTVKERETHKHTHKMRCS